MANEIQRRLAARLLAIVGAAWVFYAIPAAAQSTICEEAMNQFRASSWTNAAESFAKCEAARPGQTAALLFRGKALINLNRFDDASESLEQYIARNPGSDDGLYTLGYVRFRQDMPRESLQIFNEAARLKTPTDDDLKIVSLDYVLLGDYTDAARYLEESLKMNPNNLEARYHLGRVRYQLNQFDEAIAAFEEVLRHDPKNMKAQDNLGLCYEGKNQTEQALAAYRKAIALDQAAQNHSEQPYIDLGSLLSKTNHAADAVPLLQRATEINRRSERAQYELAKASLALNNLEIARAAGEMAVSLKPSEGSYHYLLGRIYAKLGKSGQAAQEFKITEELLRKKGSAAATTAAAPGRQ